MAALSLASQRRDGKRWDAGLGRESFAQFLPDLEAGPGRRDEPHGNDRDQPPAPAVAEGVEEGQAMVAGELPGTAGGTAGDAVEASMEHVLFGVEVEDAEARLRMDV